MNRRIVGLLSVLLFVLMGVVVTDRSLFAAPKKNKHKQEMVEASSDDFAQPVVVEDNDLGEEEIATDEFDLQKKQQEVRALVERGVEFCANNPMPAICHAL